MHSSKETSNKQERSKQAETQQTEEMVANAASSSDLDSRSFGGSQNYKNQISESEHGILIRPTGSDENKKEDLHIGRMTATDKSGMSRSKKNICISNPAACFRK